MPGVVVDPMFEVVLFDDGDYGIMQILSKKVVVENDKPLYFKNKFKATRKCNTLNRVVAVEREKLKESE